MTMGNLRAVELKRGAHKSLCRDLNIVEIASLRGTDLMVPVAYMIAASDLASLRESLPAGALVDRGTKHPAKPLAQYLGRRSGLVALRAGYTNAGQAERGVRALLSAAGEQRTRAVYFIAVSTDLFEQLWARAQPDQDAPARRGLDHSTARHLEFLLRQTASEVVPAALREKYVGTSDEAEVVRRLIVRAAKVDHPVLIEGETGTGKEVVARQIHKLSRRQHRSFLPVNCGGIPAELLESELFGHKRGAFTGAVSDKPGLWTLARDGTLFLDEIGDLSLRHQAKVLRALEDGAYLPVGGTTEVRSNARIIAATNRDLGHLVSTGRFREDLYYRLFTFRIRTPALRDHPEDIAELADHFWRRIAGPGYQRLADTVTQALENYRWPGNARELRAFLTHVLLLADHEPVDVPLIRGVMQERFGPVAHSQQDH
jgi:transcriptional regulator with AAA-type ATPase domain